uniref:Uncharacterized protein n=1 Tax=Candidatus Kentrum sp. LFY TaxID=2126342 RepID=A0A450UGJ5_9GAMM|nr:MAG: hypothetical protein BECKLFY1418A_GA0070994_101732 [Candidatus Kentron sp. LFY]
MTVIVMRFPLDNRHDRRHDRANAWTRFSTLNRMSFLASLEMTTSSMGILDLLAAAKGRAMKVHKKYLEIIG